MSTFLAVLPVVWEDTAVPCLDSMLAPDSSLGLAPHEILVVDNTRQGFLYDRIDIADGAGRHVTSMAKVPTYRDPDGHNLGTWNERSQHPSATRLDWPCLLPDLASLPLLYVRVCTPRDQAALHRDLAALGYVPELMASDDTSDYWRFAHPDGVHA